MLCRTCEILSCPVFLSPLPRASCKSYGSTDRIEAQTAGAAPACTGLLKEEDTADTSAGTSQLHLWWKPSEVTGAARGQSRSQRFKRCGSRLGCIFYTLLNHPFLKSQSKLNAKAHGQGDICLP